MNTLDVITPEVKKELIEFTQSLVRIKSVSGQEEEIVTFIEQKMKTLGYDEVIVAWKIDLNHELTRTCIAAYHENFGSDPAEYDFWDFSTNAVTPVSMGIPTIGFGPGEYKLAHMDNEYCKVHQIIEPVVFIQK
jgi:acetylornithine deacetylase/succinyl-diaminopimelate desuccinylase-like protein